MCIWLCVPKLIPNPDGNDNLHINDAYFDVVYYTTLF